MTTTPSTPRERRTAILSAVVAAVGTALLVVISGMVGQSKAESLPRYFLYQGVTLALAVAIILGIRLIVGRKLGYLRLGDWRASATRIPLLGVKQGENWMKLGLTFAVVMALVTAAYLWATHSAQLSKLPPATIVLAAAIAVPLSLSNSLIEGIITRWTIAEGFAGSARVAGYAPWVAAVIFGSAHYFGIPGGPIGSLMAGFLAWFATRSIQDTRGIGWSWLLHFVQDMLIFTVTISLFL